MTNASLFVWVDGSDSAYRQFGDSFNLSFPIGSVEGNTDDCVRFRFTSDGEISNGWLNQGCNVSRSCYFCNRPGKYEQISPLRIRTSPTQIVIPKL